MYYFKIIALSFIVFASYLKADSLDYLGGSFASISVDLHKEALTLPCLPDVEKLRIKTFKYADTLKKHTHEIIYRESFPNVKIIHFYDLMSFDYIDYDLLGELEHLTELHFDLDHYMTYLNSLDDNQILQFTYLSKVDRIVIDNLHNRISQEFVIQLRQILPSTLIEVKYNGNNR